MASLQGFIISTKKTKTKRGEIIIIAAMDKLCMVGCDPWELIRVSVIEGWSCTPNLSLLCTSKAHTEMPGLTRDGEKSYRGFLLVDSEEFILQSQNESILLQSDLIYCSH